ncbi:MAG TPA: DUF2975 domain-containing protein [Ruminococcus sp.]|nr:DUF2975 domain-containing protein [Ruminococcus sp.]
MSQKSLSKWMKIILFIFGLCGIAIFGLVIPVIGSDLKNEYLEFAFAFIPWLVFILIMAIPCYAVLVLGWKIASSIGNDNSFSNANAKRLKYVSVIALVTSIYNFAGNVVFLLLNMNHPSILIFSLFVTFVGIAISAASAILSYLVRKAAKLQEQSDLTI